MSKIISNLFFDYQQTDEYAKEFDNMSRKEDVQAAQDTFVEPLSKGGSATDDVLTSALTAMEDFGFEQGFKYAMRLRNECNI